jgi:hypothetical protein
MSTLGASIGAGLAQGAEAVQAYERARPERELRLAEAKNRQRQSQLALDEFQSQAGNRMETADLELQQLQYQVGKQQTENLKNDTYQAFRLFNADGDTRHMNNFLASAKKNPKGQKMWGGYARFDPVTEENRDLLNAANIEDPIEDLKGNFVIATGTNGEQQLVRMDKLQASTGYTSMMTQQELKDAQQRATIANLITGPRSADTTLIRDIAKENKISLAEATKIFNESKRRQGGSALERIAANIRSNNPQMSEEESLVQAKQVMSSGSASEREARELATEENIPYKEALDRVNRRKERTSPRKQLDEASDTRARLDKLGDKSFFDVDLTDDAARRKAGPLIVELEKLTGREPTTEDKRVARQIRDLTALGNTAGTDITAEETGIIDRIFKNVKKYVSDDVTGGDKAAAAYEAFRNVFRHDLYGASLTATENKKFEAAMGNLGQQAGPVLAQLNEAMGSLKNQLQAVYDTNDEHIAYYYFGRSLDDLDRAIERIDERIETVATVEPEEVVIKGQTEEEQKAAEIKAKQAEWAKKTPEEKQAELSRIFGGAK